LSFWLLLAAAPGTLAQGDADRGFERIADDYIAALPRLSPITATNLGDHSRDGELDDVSASGRRARRELLMKFRKRVDALQRDELSRANQVDMALLQNKLDAELFAIDRLQEWAWNPTHYVDLAGSGLYGLLARDFAPLESRLQNVAARLDAMPAFLRQSRSQLQVHRVPKIHAETALAQNAGVISIIDGMIVPHLDSVTDDSRARLEAAIDSARHALEQHQDWLANKLLPRATGEFRIGAFLFDEKLRYALDSPLARKDIRARAEFEYEAVRKRMYQVAKQVYAGKHPLTAFPDIPDEAFKQAIIRAALEEAYRRLPEPDRIVETARTYLQQATEFVIEKNLVTVPDDTVEVIVMPEFQRGVSVAYLDPAGPLDGAGKSFYAVAPLPADWTREQVNSFLREYNLLSLQALTIHEGTPGHYLQLALSRRYPSALRSVLWSGTFVEGWGVYAERMMVDEGYLDNDPLMQLIILKWYLRTITNAIIDQGIHVDGMTREAAMNLMIEGGFQEESEAAGKWVRAQLTSTQLSTYFIGYQEHRDMRAAVERAWGDEFTLRRYHDQALSYGSPPVKYVRALMLGEAIPGAGYKMGSNRN
jgi:uncharacterized protein (DUF885 family)